MVHNSQYFKSWLVITCEIAIIISSSSSITYSSLIPKVPNCIVHKPN